MDYAQLLGMTGGNSQGAGITNTALGGGNVGAQLLGASPAALPGAGFRGFAPTSTVPDLLAKYRAQAPALPPVQAAQPVQAPVPAPASAPVVAPAPAPAQLSPRDQLLSTVPPHQRELASQLIDSNMQAVQFAQMGQPWSYDPYEAQGGMSKGLASVIYGPSGMPTSPVLYQQNPNPWGTNDG